MLIRISLIVALLAALAVGVVNIVFVKDKLNTLITDRNTQRSGRLQAEGERDTAKTAQAKAEKDLAQKVQELADAQSERDKAVNTAKAATSKAEELTDRLNRTTQERDQAQTDLAAYKATGLTAQQVVTLNDTLKKTRDELDIAKEEQLVLQRTVNRLQARLSLYEGTNRDITMRANLRGKILVVDPRWDFVVLDIGQDQGVVDNGELLVSREGKLVAKVIVRTIDRNRSIANILPGWKLGEVIEGDEVTPAHPAT